MSYVSGGDVGGSIPYGHAPAQATGHNILWEQNIGACTAYKHWKPISLGHSVVISKQPFVSSKRDFFASLIH